jgi:hypothetical protein
MSTPLARVAPLDKPRMSTTLGRVVPKDRYRPVQHVHASRRRLPPRQGQAVPAINPRRLSPPESYFSASLRRFLRRHRHRQRHYVHHHHHVLRLPGVQPLATLLRLSPTWPYRRLVQVQHNPTPLSPRVLPPEWRISACLEPCPCLCRRYQRLYIHQLLLKDPLNSAFLAGAGSAV